MKRNIYKVGKKLFITSDEEIKAERSYSEEEVLEIIEHYKSYMETFIY